MNSSRLQPLNTIYQDLYALLYDTIVLLYTTDFTKEEAEATLRKTENTLASFDYQTAIEEAILFPALHDYEPFLVALLRDDHRERIQYVRRLEAMIQKNEMGSEAYRSILFSSRLLRHFNEFMACCIEQMKNHEAAVNPVLWRYYSDSELEYIKDSIREAQTGMQSRHARMAKKKREPASVY